MDSQTIERVKKGLNNSEIGPETIALILTKVCNLNCVYCRGGRLEQKNNNCIDISDELTTQELFELFKDAKALQVKEINLGGMDGDPFCKKDILKIMQKIKQLGFIGSMTTNGSFLNSEIAKVMTDYNWDILLLSFDSADEFIHQALRPAINKKPYFNNIIQFFDTLDSIGSNLRVLLNVVINKLNYKALPDLVSFANKHKNIESINLLRLLNMGLVNYVDLELNSEELKEFKLILTGLKNEKKLMYAQGWLNCDEPLGRCLEPGMIKNSLLEESGCFTNYYILSINSNGDIMKCPQYQSVADGLNIRRLPLREIWVNGHRNFRQGLAKKASCYTGCCTILKEQNRLIVSKLLGDDL